MHDTIIIHKQLDCSFITIDYNLMFKSDLIPS